MAVLGGSDAERGNCDDSRYVLTPTVVTSDPQWGAMWIIVSRGSTIQPRSCGSPVTGRRCARAAIARSQEPRGEAMRQRKAKKRTDPLSPTLPELLMEVNTVVKQALDDIPDVKARRTWARTYDSVNEVLYQRLLLVDEPPQDRSE